MGFRRQAGPQHDGSASTEVRAHPNRVEEMPEPCSAQKARVLAHAELLLGEAEKLASIDDSHRHGRRFNPCPPSESPSEAKRRKLQQREPLTSESSDQRKCAAGLSAHDDC